METTKQFGHWTLSFDVGDGARIGFLSYDGTEILTKRSDEIRIPVGDFGKYETRSPYGYDDCFPAVDSSVYPGLDWDIPDHGELCWLPWNVEEKENSLLFSVNSNVLPLSFVREMVFNSDKLTWNFEVKNNGNTSFPFQHVMHALLPLNEIENIELPEFSTILDDIQGKNMNLQSSSDVRDYLLSTEKGNHHMLFLQNIEEGRVNWEYNKGFMLEMVFDKMLFPSLGIWWNNHSYPDEQNSRRTECAFEPVPGFNTNLMDANNDGVCMIIQPGECLKWKIIWNIHNT